MSHPFARSPEPEPPIRAELFSIERLEQHAESMAAEQKISPKRATGSHLLSRVKDNAASLTKGYRGITKAINEGRAITPASEWLVDNFHVIEDQIREIIDDLPPGFYRRLPKLAEGFLAGTPRVYGVAWAFVAHTDSRFDPDWLRRFVRAYQRADALSIGEVWALAISLRIVLVENLRRLSDLISTGGAARMEADVLADALLRPKNESLKDPMELLRPYDDFLLQRSFAVQLVQRLREQGEVIAPVLEWLDQRLAAQGTSAEEIVRLEHQDQAAMNATVRNVITSMRLISAMDWAQFFEDVAVVDEILRAENPSGPGGFASMDFSSRDNYRHAIEELSRGSDLSEVEVAKRAMQASRTARVTIHASEDNKIDADRKSDPGHYLISKGRILFEKEIGFRVPLKIRLRRLVTRCATPIYLGSIALLTALFLAVPLALSFFTGMPLSLLFVFGILGLIPASDMAVALVSSLITNSIQPEKVSKLDFSKGIPVDFKTLVVMPTLLTSHDDVEEMLGRLEIHHLSNPDDHLQFALLTDWCDAPQEHMSEDEALLKTAIDGIGKINDRYGPGSDNNARFFLLHRRRLWNPKEGVWMGWERKRGKLDELTRLLRGDTKTTFLNVPQVPSGIRYVITLDADTHMPHGAAIRLVGAMAHPLNRPRFDSKKKRVVEGYGVMQPRITPTLPTAGSGSLYQQIYSGPAGIDPYAFAVSDVYQDLFKEGSYIGKGIFDVDAFAASLQGRVPENTMLSHDLFEGLYARAALVTDIELFEEFPSHFEVAVARNHRWVRGDWQLLSWIFKWKLNLPLISRWKMVDNLRRSLSGPAVYLTLACCWLLPRSPADVWMSFILTTLALPSLLPIFLDLLPKRRTFSILNHLKNVGADFQLAVTHVVLAIVFMAHQAWVMADSIIRTLYRLTISRRRLLEWTSAAISKNYFDNKLKAFYGRGKGGPLLAILTGSLSLMVAPQELRPIIFSFVFIWILSPWIAQRLSLPKAGHEGQAVRPKDRAYFRLIARKTWGFFEAFVTSTHHFLPPDNFQEIPQPVVAHRTSPTNIGLYLLSTVAARDFGWIGVLEAVERLEATMATVKILPRYQGHLFNWYDTLDLRPLDPLYVSTVDSGNLAGHLITVSNACRQLLNEPFSDQNILNGFEDVLLLIKEATRKFPDDRHTETVTGYHVEEAMSGIRALLQNFPERLFDRKAYLEELRERTVTLVDIALALVSGQREHQKLEILKWSKTLLHQIEGHIRDLTQRTEAGEVPPALSQRINDLADLTNATAREMQFGFLFDTTKKIFSIGFQVTAKKLDPSFYDLLASEARIASFVAIAKGDVPALHWFHLSRSFRPLDNGLVLLSWSGSMFEYLMPSLVMKAPLRTILDQTNRQIVRRQIAFGRERNVPWGISESAYNAQNIEFTYQYSNFGIPGIGLKRGLLEDLVIAPYATALAAMVDPVAAAENFRNLVKAGAEGPYGFYESLDYTPVRLPENKKVAVVQAYMAHHQGMSLVSLANVLYDGIMRDRFHAEPMVQAAELLLQERTPREVSVSTARIEDVDSEVRPLVPMVWRRFQSPHDVIPRTHLLSNGRYSVMITAAGSGYSKNGNLAVMRWREDSTRDNWGTFIFIRDAVSGEAWSAGYQPLCVTPEKYEVDFSEDRAEIIRMDGSIETTLEVVVSPEDNAEIRRVTLKNMGHNPRDIDVTSYGEVVLATPAADQAHPAFSNLFVQTEFVPRVNGLICTRRQRSPDDSPLWMGHVVVVEGETLGEVQYETDRAKFLGRGREIHSPKSIFDGRPLSNSSGPVLNPIVSLRRRVRIMPGESIRVAFTTLMASSREEAIGLADKYHDPVMFERTVTLAWTHAHIQHHYLGMALSEAHLFQNLASRIIYSHKGLRPSQDILKLNSRSASGLWAHGISGDIPIVLVRIDETDDRGIVRDLLRAHEYWRMKNLMVDLVILNERGASYAQDLQSALDTIVRTTQAGLHHETHDPHGGIFIIRADQISPEDRILLRTAARVTLLSRHGSLAQQIERLEESMASQFEPPSHRQPKPTQPPVVSIEKPNLQFFNGLGGFSADGKEYVTMLGAGQSTPTPWINVIANPDFGFHVSESGSGTTWSLNSRENQITPWSNDPVSDPSGDVFYIRDEDSGQIWTPTMMPIREESSSYISRHGQGYSRFEHTSHGIHTELTQFVPVNDPIKISRLILTNKSHHSRRLSVTAYVEWVMGTSRAISAPFIITEINEETGAVLARNPWNNEFASRVAFADLAGEQNSWTCDRSEFLGRNGTLERPLALEPGFKLSGKTGAGMDPCTALQTEIEIGINKRVEVVFFLGETESREKAVELIRRFRKTNLDTALQEVEKYWEVNLTAVQVSTPDPAMDILLNRWLLYQTLVCRMWARAGFYQAGGAYGFRDQLQDTMALVVSRRDIAREHILRAARRQFSEGDVQHWWHPPSGRGVRTKISDDLVWLPYVLTHYLEVTGDLSILDEAVPFLAGQSIPEGREDLYFQPIDSAETATLFEHCARALDRSLVVGSHGLPLMGSGDWNDGMNRVGHEGKGESVWLAWFLHTTLWEFSKLAQTRGDFARAEKWRLHVGELKTAVERHGWDGEWYLRAYFDDGKPLGSTVNTECRIDSIAQSWGVLSGGADPARAQRAMAAVKDHLIRRDDNLVLIFTPPFNKTVPNPGYIQGYLPGVRENGGQYTHAAIWALSAFAALGDGNMAGDLFSMLNPINRGKTRTDINRYKVEPYVMAADVYAEFPHVGRGGWTWYTGSAGWMYRAGLESILGFRLRDKKLFIDPCIPSSWPSFELNFRYHSSRYDVTVENPKSVCRGVQLAQMDGKPVRALEGIMLVDDGKEHRLRIVLG